MEDPYDVGRIDVVMREQREQGLGGVSNVVA
jgi:hypothetical protein